MTSESLNRLRGRSILVAGAAISGLAAARALVELGARVLVCDDSAERLGRLPPGCEAAQGLTEVPADTALVVTSPGWRPDNPLLRSARDAGVEVIGEPELAWRWTGPGGPGEGGAGSAAPRWWAVTGTNGKTTTVGMLESILTTAGRDAVACGNVGTPVIDAVRDGRTDLVVELSSFQLHWSPSIRPDGGCLLNVAEDHLDWHGGMPAYLAAKEQALTGAVAVAGTDDPVVAAALARCPAPTKVGITLGEPAEGQFGVLDGALTDHAGPELVPLLEAGEVRPPGPPGLIDALAAAALARAAGVPPSEVADGLRTFGPGPHRGAIVGERAGVRFVNDSKATNPHAADAALAGHSRVVWIAGGVLKGASVTQLVHDHAHRLAGVVLIGIDRGTFRDALLRHAPQVQVEEVRPGEDGPMTDAVALAAGMAAPGDVVLLAPAAASLDQFRDYAARGDAFADAVAALPHRESPGLPSDTPR